MRGSKDLKMEVHILGLNINIVFGYIWLYSVPYRVTHYREFSIEISGFPL